MTIEEWAEEFKSYVNALDIQRDDYKGIIEYIDDAIELIRNQQSQIAMLVAAQHELCEMIKEHEAELSFRNAKPITHTATKLDDATCPSCGNVVGRVKYDYCHYCGQKLDWEGR